MRLLIDESLSPSLAIRLAETGRHNAVHPLHIGRRGAPDHRVLAQCLTEDRVLVTQNARDFRKLVGAVELHPGLIILPGVGRERSMALLWHAIAYLESLGDPMDAMVNAVLEVDSNGKMVLMSLPAER